MACDPLSDIVDLGYCDGNPPGLTKIYYIPAEDVTVIPGADANTHTISTDLTVSSGKKWYELPFQLGTGGFDEKAEGDPGAKSWSAEVNAFVPKDRDVLTYNAHLMIGGKYLVIATEANGENKLIGSLTIAATLTQADLATGLGGTDKNGRQWQFRLPMNSNHPAYHYTGAIPLTPVP